MSLPLAAVPATILLAEDEAALRRLLGEILRRAGYQVLAAANGSEALAASRDFSGGIDLLIADIVMPAMSGVALAVRLGADRPEMRTLLISGGHAADPAAEAEPRPSAAYLRKPFAPHDLLRQVSILLATGAGS